MALIKNLLLLTVLFSVHGVKWEYAHEFEDVLTEAKRDTTLSNWQSRSTASGGKTLRIKDTQGNKNVKFTLCITSTGGQNVSLQIKEILYSNDGGSDVFDVRLNNSPHGSFNTIALSNFGQEWNVMKSSGNVGPLIEVIDGTYDIDISATTDDFGVELDKIVFETENLNPEPYFFCYRAKYED